MYRVWQSFGDAANVARDVARRFNTEVAVHRCGGGWQVRHHSTWADDGDLLEEPEWEPNGDSKPFGWDRQADPVYLAMRGWDEED